jgi:hemolysin III
MRIGSAMGSFWRGDRSTGQGEHPLDAACDIMHVVTAPRMTLGKMQNPVRGLMNALAAVAAAVGTGTLLWRAPAWSGRVALLVFGAGLIALFTTSSLYHSIPWRSLWYRRMQRLDHSMIFVLIAASYTPMAVIVIDGWLSWATIAVAWGIALSGVGLVMVLPRSKHGISIALMVGLGWISLPLMVPVAAEAGVAFVVLIGIGGILYTVGMVFLVSGRPRLWPRVFSHHELFHVFVIGAAALHFAANFRYVAPLA